MKCSPLGLGVSVWCFKVSSEDVAEKGKMINF